MDKKPLLFGSQLRKQRKDLEYTQEYCAEFVGVNRRTWIRWERRKTPPRSDSSRRNIKDLFPDGPWETF